MKDYIVQFRIKNGPLMRAMRLAGYDSVAELSRASGVTLGIIYRFLGLREVPIRADGEWRTSALRLAEHLRCLPDQLFPPQHIEKALKTSTAEMEMSLDDIEALPGSAMKMLRAPSPEDANIRGDIRDVLLAGLDKLTPRQRDVIERRFGVSGDQETLEQIAERYGVSRERIRSIESKAMRRLKHPGVTARLVEAGYIPPRPERDRPA